MKTRVAALAIASLAGLMASHSVMAQEPGLMVRGRLTYLSMQTTSSAGVLPGDAIDVNSKAIPEIDFSWFFTRNIAAELVLTIPQSQDVSVSGSKIGTFKHLPPTLLAQWHFDGLGAFQPYVGLGVNYTAIFSQNMSVGGTPVTLEHKSWGPAFQIGADYQLDKHWYLNADLKKVYIKSDVYLGGTNISQVKLNPYLVSVGVGYHF